MGTVYIYLIYVFNCFFHVCGLYVVSFIHLIIHLTIKETTKRLT